MKLLKFEASWCGPCKALTKLMESTQLPVPIEVIDVDESAAVAAQYGIRSVPTLVLVDDAGAEVKRKVGMMSSDDLTTFATV